MRKENILLTSLLLLGPTSYTKAQVNYIQKFAGGYTIEVKGYSGADIEAYALRKDGTASWMWIEPDGEGGAKVMSKKAGTWSATATSITVKIKGNTGILTTKYILQNGIFVESTDSNRYLKPNK